MREGEVGDRDEDDSGARTKRVVSVRKLRLSICDMANIGRMPSFKVTKESANRLRLEAPCGSRSAYLIASGEGNGALPEPIIERQPAFVSHDVRHQGVRRLPAALSRPIIPA